MADNDLTMEVKEEFMVSPKGDTSDHRRAFILKPYVAAINRSAIAPSLSRSTDALEVYGRLPLSVCYLGWKNPPRDWNSWVDRMHSLHHSTWRRAGILAAIMASKSVIQQYDVLVLGVVEKWCPTTNTFVFPWGEATITLEDMLMLGGYSAMGDSALIPFQNEGKQRSLQEARYTLSRSKAKKASQSQWIAYFNGSGSEIEHEAFLAYWLARFVFPFSRDAIGKHVVSIAVHLSRGNRIALAPFVLASIYKSLTLLKNAVLKARRSETVVQMTVSAPLALFQAWIWERFPLLRPRPGYFDSNGPRLARWHNMEMGLEYRNLNIDSAGEDFQWRPYTADPDYGNPGVVYLESGNWETYVVASLDDHMRAYVRCLRTSELVGLEEDYIEQYLPHRVAMQFGLVQDIPCYVERVNGNKAIAWNHFTRPVKDTELFVAPRVCEPLVTARYKGWWKRLNSGKKVVVPSSNVQVKKEVIDVDDDLPPPPGFPPKPKGFQKGETSGKGGGSMTRKRPRDSSESSSVLKFI